MSRCANGLTIGALLIFAGCGPAGAGGPSINADLLTREEIVEAGPSNAHDIIQALRPMWLKKRGQTSFVQEGEIRVYQDGTGIGGIDVLRGLHSDNIESIRFLNERPRNMRFLFLATAQLH